MKHTVARPVPPVPTPGLIATLNARTWLDHTINGRVFSPLLLTYPAPQFEDIDPAEVERKMLGVAASLGAAPLSAELPDAGERVTLHPGGTTLVHLDNSPYALHIPKHPRWSQAISQLGQVLLAIGLDELSPVASRAEINEYIEAAGENGRMHFAIARVTESPRAARLLIAARTTNPEPPPPRAPTHTL